MFRNAPKTNAFSGRSSTSRLSLFSRGGGGGGSGSECLGGGTFLGSMSHATTSTGAKPTNQENQHSTRRQKQQQQQHALALSAHSDDDGGGEQQESGNHNRDDNDNDKNKDGQSLEGFIQNNTTRATTEQQRNNSKNNNENSNGILVAEPNPSTTTTGRGGGIRAAIAVALSLAYFTVMGAKCALPSVLPLLVPSNHNNQHQHHDYHNNGGLIFAAHQDPTTCLQRMFTWSTLAIALGKLLLGPLIDTVGGSTALKALLTLLCALFGFLALNQSFTAFMMAYIAIDFFFSACWPASIHAIHQFFPTHEWGAQIGHLATGARAGNALAFWVFAQVLQFMGQFAVVVAPPASSQQLLAASSSSSLSTTTWWSTLVQQPWRPVFALSGLVQLVPLAMIFVFCRPQNRYHDAVVDANDNNTKNNNNHNKTTVTTTTKNNNDHNHHQEYAVDSSPASSSSSSSKPSLKRTFSIALQEAQRLPFWLQFTSRTVLMVFASILLFIPTILCQVYQTSSSVGSQAGSIYAIGCLLAVTLGSRRYAALASSSTNTKNWCRNHILVLVALLGCATAASAAQLAHVSPRIPFVMSPTGSCLSFFVWGAAMAIPFYIPPSLYALKRGGTECSATIADLFDMGGFALLAWFNRYVVGLPNKSDPSVWIPTFQMTTACALTSMVALVLFTLQEHYQQQQQQQQQQQHVDTEHNRLPPQEPRQPGPTEPPQSPFVATPSTSQPKQV
ncbi:hypothetical protein ACA910_019192 [Epithemia clementina (nom. ined.)]